MGFKAEEHVEPLDFDFNPFVDIKGTIPEPSDLAVQRFLKRWWKLVDEIRRVGLEKVVRAQQAGAELTEEQRAEIEAGAPRTVSDAIQAMTEIDTDEVEGQKSDAEKISDRMCAIVSELSGGKLSEETLAQVPYRPRAMFIGWLISELTDPEKGKAESKNTLRVV